MLQRDFALDAKSINKLSNKGLCIESLKKQIDLDIDTTLEIWHAQGLELIKHHGYFYFSTRYQAIQDATFCIVDIETNGSKIEKHQIIEIAAVQVQNGKIIDSFESLIQCKQINSHITEITGISTELTKDAPQLKEVMYNFRTFLADSIFVAHDVKFDYRFISDTLVKLGLEPLLNRSLCSLDLAQRSLISYKYGLSYLNEYFKLYPEATHHRAMSDVITTYELFILSLSKLDKEIKKVEELIRFSKEGKMLKRLKFDPLLEDQKE
jgi:DNA polymerase-3 subunit epsilon